MHKHSMLTERQKSVLKAVVKAYVARPEPVASADLARQYGFTASPATIRNDLQVLEEAGYLTQPHTSAGRVPTDRAYRFFISEMSVPASVSEREERSITEIREADDPPEFAKHASRILATLTRNVAIAGFPEDDIFYKSGFGEAMRSPEFEELPMVQEFSELLDEIDELVLRLVGHALPSFREPRVWIGHENPIAEARRYSMILSACETPFGKEGIVAVIGPTRMDYRKNLAIIRRFRNVMSQNEIL